VLVAAELAAGWALAELVAAVAAAVPAGEPAEQPASSKPPARTGPASRTLIRNWPVSAA
jgi:hypothetical protein